MPNLTTIGNVSKNLGRIFIILLILVLILAGIYFRFIRKQTKENPLFEPQILQDKDQKQPQSFDFKNSKLVKNPHSLPIFLVQVQGLNDQNIGTQFGLTAKP